MASRKPTGYEDLRAQGWVPWPDVESQAGLKDRGFGGVKNLRRWVRLLAEADVWPADLPRPVRFPRPGQGGDALYHPKTAAFLRDAARLHPYAHFRGQRHSVGEKTRPLAPLRLLLAVRGWEYNPDSLRQDVVAVAEQFWALAGRTWAPDRLGVWLFTGNVPRQPGKRSAYWRAKVCALMAWLSLLAGTPVRAEIWNGLRRPPAWERILQSVQQADPATLSAWIAALRPLVDGWCFSPPQPQTEQEIVNTLLAPPPPVEEIRRDNIATRVFRLLHRGLEDAYQTRPGDVERWEQARKKTWQRAGEKRIPSQAMWYRARYINLNTRREVWRLPRDPALYYPDNQAEVVTRLFKYAGVFVALGIATHDPARTEPVAPLPEGRPLPSPWGLCCFCEVPLRAEIIATQPRVWCPRCFTDVHELAGFLSRWDDDAKTWRMIVPSG